MKHIRLNEELANLISRSMNNIRKTFVVVCCLAYLLFNLNSIYAQTGTQNGEQKQVLSQLEQKMVNFLSTVQSRQKEVQAQIDQLEVELQNHQAKKKKKKNQAADELTEKTLKEKIATLSAKKEQYKKMENDANTFLSSVKNKQESAQTEKKSNTGQVAQTQQNRQTQTAPVSEKERQIQAVMQRINELTEEINKRKQATQTGQTGQAAAPSSEREKRLQELEQSSLALNEKIKAYQNQRNASTRYDQSGQVVLTEKERRIQEVMQRIDELTEEINRRKSGQTQQAVAATGGQTQTQQRPATATAQTQTQQRPATATTQTQQRPATATAKTQTQQRPTTATGQTQQLASGTSGQTQVSQAPVTEKEKKIQEVMQKIEDLTEEINRRKGIASGEQKPSGQVAASSSSTTSQPAVSSDKDKRIKELEKMVADLNTQVRSYTQNQQSQTSSYEQKQRELTATISAKDRKIQELERNLALLNNQTNRISTVPRQEPTTSARRTQSTTAQRSSSTTARNQPMITQANITSGYYIIFGSFIERNNAERFLAKLEKKYPNVIDLGNENIFGMYRTGIGPYRTKEEAIANRPTDAKNWVLRVETVPNTRLVAYFEILEE
jgi:chromosome segregation ATPase